MSRYDDPHNADVAHDDGRPKSPWQPCQLIDDGTLDTVATCIHGTEFRYSTDFAADYRDDTGALDWPRFRKDVLTPDCANAC